VCDGPAVRGGRGVLAAALVILGFLGLASGCGAPQPAAAPAPPPDAARILGSRQVTRSTDIETLSRDADLLVVMPEGGSAGFYSDWLSGPRWETFHTEELPALLAAGYRAGDRQAVAGVSMGGLGALGYAGSTGSASSTAPGRC
jgi:hypothetical protein